MELAGQLRCTTAALTMLRLCPLPREGAEGATDIRRVTEQFGRNLNRLAAGLGLRWG
jgi:hypothetical protein